MILLDTNVVSELMRPAPEPAVIDWLNRQDARRVGLSAISVAEISYGVQCLADGQRKRMLTDRFEQFLRRGFAHRIFDFDEPAALAYGELMAHRRSIGRPMSVLDGQLAAIATCRGFSLATRNTPDFEHIAVDLVDPWSTC